MTKTTETIEDETIATPASDEAKPAESEAAGDDAVLSEVSVEELVLEEAEVLEVAEEFEEAAEELEAAGEVEEAAEALDAAEELVEVAEELEEAAEVLEVSERWREVASVRCGSDRGGRGRGACGGVPRRTGRARSVRRSRRLVRRAHVRGVREQGEDQSRVRGSTPCR